MGDEGLAKALTLTGGATAPTADASTTPPPTSLPPPREPPQPGAVTKRRPLQDELDALRKHFHPAQERLWAKIAAVEQELELVNVPPGPLTALRDRSFDNAAKARACFAGNWGHPHLAWRFLHRVDEDLILLVDRDGLAARALGVRSDFDVNISDPGVRALWLGTEGGEKGPLAKAVESLNAGEAPTQQMRETVRAALQMVNGQVDRRFWVLSENMLTSVWSGVLLVAALAASAVLWATTQAAVFAPITQLGQEPAADLLPVMLLGVMGAYASNLLTRRDFLFVQGGPYWRYLLYPLLAKPILSAFAAAFVYVVARSAIVFSLGPPDGSSGPVVSLGVPAGATAFAFAVLAVVSGFAADKLLRDMIDRVLKRLEERAEKSTRANGATQ